MKLLSSLTALTLFVSIASADEPKSKTDPRVPLHDMIGVWDLETKFWPTPNGEPLVSKGTETNTMLGDGLWVLSTFEGNFGGVPFRGQSQIGYNPTKKKYVGTWIDSMSPYMTKMEGTYDAESETMTLLNTGRDPQTGKMMYMKTVSTKTAPGKLTMTFTVTDAKGTANLGRMMEFDYTKRD